VVFNPASGRRCHRTVTQRRRELATTLAAHGIEPRWYDSDVDRVHSSARRALAEGAELVLACGGDGTVNACADALAATPVPLAVVPAGTGNLIAASLGLPVGVRAAVQVALHGQRLQVDLGTGAGGRFVCVASMGFGAAVIRDADAWLKARTGMAGYLLAALRRLDYPADTFQITIDGATQIIRSGHAVLVGNLGQLASPRRVRAALDDGRFEVAVLRIRPTLDWIRQYHRALRLRRPPPVEWYQGHHIEVVAGRSHPAEHDGEWVGTTRRLSVDVQPRALTVCVPPRRVRTGAIRRLVARALYDALRLPR
jgi:diacylglycerol kinase family enzyme